MRWIYTYLYYGFDFSEAIELAGEKVYAHFLKMAQDNAAATGEQFTIKKHFAPNMRSGTTVAAVLLDGYSPTIGYVGDSRIYSFRQDGSRSLATLDDSLGVMALQDNFQLVTTDPQGQPIISLPLKGLKLPLFEAGLRTFPRSNIITKALGLAPSTRAFVYPAGEMAEGELLLICSDGLFEALGTTEMHRIVAEGRAAGKGLNDIALGLREAVLAKGRDNHDNFTVILFERPAAKSYKVSVAARLQMLDEAGFTQMLEDIIASGTIPITRDEVPTLIDLLAEGQPILTGDLATLTTDAIAFLKSLIQPSS
jgi:serine/threonine protein phosphatase PrpC